MPSSHHKHITITSSYLKLYLSLSWGGISMFWRTNYHKIPWKNTFHWFIATWIIRVIIAPTPHVVSPIVTLKCNPKTGEIYWQIRLTSSHDDGVTKCLSNYPPKSSRSYFDHDYENTVLILFKAKFATVMEKYSI